jgi:uncharacterized membrane protein
VDQRLSRASPYALAAVLFAAYAALSISRHRRLETSGFDLGIFEQAVRGYAESGTPIAELKGPAFHLLGDHFHPILAVLAPVYWLLPSAVTLLVAQAALLAVSVVPVARLGGLWIGAAYGLSWGIQEAVGFDFHEICFAVPLLAFSLERLVKRQWGYAVAWALPLVLVKEDLPVTVAAIGLYVAAFGPRRLGLAVAGFALLAEVLIVLVAIPAFNGEHTYPYLRMVATNDQDPLARLAEGHELKLTTLVTLLAPTAFVALRSPIVLLAVPTLAWRFWSEYPGYWGTGYHYSAVLMPIVFVAFADGLPKLPRLDRRWLVAISLAVTLAILPERPLANLAEARTWRANPVAAAVRAELAMIPEGASVASVNSLAAQLTGRCQVYLFPTYPSGSVRPEWVVVTDRPDNTVIPAAEVAARMAMLPDLGYRPVARGGGLTLWKL